MELKKNPKVDIHSKTGLFLNLGLVVSLLVTIAAFEWKFYDDGGLLDLGQVNDDFEDIMDIPPTEQPPPPPPKIQQPEIIEVPDEEDIDDEIEVDLDIDVAEDDVIDFVFDDGPEEEVSDEIFSIVEEQAEPEGGIQAFYEYVGRELNKKYPRQAQRMGIEGSVFIQFVIERDGSITDVQAVKGIGGGCDEVAVEVVKNSPKWKPGKQRGQAVRSRRIIPIKFVLN